MSVLDDYSALAQELRARLGRCRPLALVPPMGRSPVDPEDGDEEPRRARFRRVSSGAARGGLIPPRRVARRLGPSLLDEDDERRSRGGGGGGSDPAGRAGGGAGRTAARAPTRGVPGTRASGGRGPQAAVVKLASFTSGRGRAGALADYLSRDGALVVETHTGERLEGTAVIGAELDRWAERFDNRQPSKDVAALVVTAMSPPSPISEEMFGQAVSDALRGYRHALTVARSEDGAFEAYVVVKLAGEERGARLKLDGRGKARLAEEVRAATEAGEGSVLVALTGTSHGREGAVYRLERLVERGTTRTQDGRTLCDAADARAEASAWAPTLRSRQVRDTMHLIASARAGTDPEVTLQAARVFLGRAFPGHAYMFARHEDRGHVHVHAMVVMRGASGHKLHPTITTFGRWRELYAEAAREQGLDMVASRRLERAAVPAYRLAHVKAAERGVASEAVRRRIEAKQTDAVHV
ncbi:MAG TPA: relaxase/mobilization nuclease domain-containing protein, partial [Beijerinckiaceae bacterium]|nr:relaxase/mobilization nuclease domain-containing protein [Beijerinckiaceae bacterium]